jgi:hypothetical protein
MLWNLISYFNLGAYYLAKQYGPTGKLIVTIAADHGTKYTSKLYNEEYLAEKNFVIGDLSKPNF